jgi:hypothetical protein
MFLFLLAVFSRPAKSMASEHRMLGLHPKVIMQIFGRVSAGFYLLLNSFIIIRFGRILPLRPTTHQYGNPYFSQWGSVVPNFKIKCVLSRVPTFASTDVHFKGRIQIYNILKFTEDKNFVNFSLVSPMKIGTHLVNLISSRYELSCGMVSQSQLESVSAQLKFPYHQLSITPHCQDAERLSSLCMIAGKNTLIGQTYKNAISFQMNVAPAGELPDCLFMYSR